MTKIALIIASLVASLTTNVLAAETLRSRIFPSCGYVGKQIYCCGGDTGVTASNADTMDMNLYSLNVSQFVGRPSDSMSSQWNKITYASPFSIEARRTPSSVVLSDGVRFLINGGHNMYGNKLTNQTIVYDTSTNTWTKATSYVVQGLGTRQIYYSTAVNLPNDLVGFFGGLEQAANASVPFITTTGEVMALDGNNGSYVGFHRLTMITSGATAWSDYSPQSTPLANFFPNSQSATINTATGKIYYLGGSYYYPASNGYPTRVPFNWAAVFDSKSGSWLNETLTGIIPTDRIYHSATLMPNSQDLLLYGGSNDGLAASTDYCFTLNLQTNEWTKQDNLNVPSYLSGPRYAHSAVAVDTTLFILFGKGLDGALNPSLLTIDIADAKNITYIPIYQGIATIDTSNDTTNGDAHGGANDSKINGPPGKSGADGNSGGLSKGAVGGIAAGCVVVGLGLIAFLFFYLRRQKKNKHQEQEEDNVQESMHVDWDRIEGQYKEIPIPVTSTSPQLSESTNFTGNTLITSSVVHQSPNLADENVIVTRNKNPDIANDMVKPSTHLTGDYTIVKPDGN